jgi:hypothetical protein
MAVDPSWLEGVPDPPRTGDLDDVDLAGRLDVGGELLDGHGFGELYPAFAWSLLVGQEGQQLQRVQAAYPFVDRVSFGFVEPEVDEQEPGLAVIVYVNPPEDALGSGELHDAFPEAGPVTVGDVEFPVVVRIGVHELQVQLSSPSTARVAAWTTVHRKTSPQSGWLVPFHAVGGRRRSVRFDDGSTGQVVVSFGPCMDAVVASSSGGMPSSLSSTGALDVLPPGLTLQVVDRNGNVRSPTLKDVEVNAGLIAYNKAPIRVTYDWTTAMQGDSGALVTWAQTGAPVAMHQGVSPIHDRKGVQKLDHSGQPIKLAFGLCLYQIEAAADGEFFL